MMPRYLVRLCVANDKAGTQAYGAEVWDTRSGELVWGTDEYVYGPAGLLEVTRAAMWKTDDVDPGDEHHEVTR